MFPSLTTTPIDHSFVADNQVQAFEVLNIEPPTDYDELCSLCG